MKNYIIGFLSICILVLLSFIYKASKTQRLDDFPLENKAGENSSVDPPLYLYIYFSRNNCHECLDAIQSLNELQYPFVVTGIVPVNELKNEVDLRNTTRAAFNLISFRDDDKSFKPTYTPAIYGVSGNGKILFILPGVPGEKKYLYDFLVNFYSKSIELLIPDIEK